MSKICERFHLDALKQIPGIFLLSPFVDRLIKIMGSTTDASKEEVLLGVRTDSDLQFKEHMTSICSKANRKLQASTRFSNVTV